MASLPPYSPVSCILHERLEYAVLRRSTLKLRWRDDAGSHAAMVRPLDVMTRDGAEWLTFRSEEGESVTVRLDQIEAVREMPVVASSRG